jgi:hypothetical protein
MRTSPTPGPASTPKPDRDVPEEDSKRATWARWFSPVRTRRSDPRHTLMDLSSVAEAMLEEAIVETGAARMSREAQIRAPVVSPDGDDSPSR